MTEFQHALLGSVIMMILFNVFFKQFFVTKKDLRRYQEIINRFINKQ